jgi:Leishmanolysin
VDDLVIHATGMNIDGPGRQLGGAFPDAFRAGSRLPYHGNMRFDTADLAVMEADGTLLSVILHEMAHILGFASLWSAKGLLVNAGTVNVGFTGPQAVAAYNEIFGTTATAVPVESGGGAGTANGHWRETVFGNELMTGFVGPGLLNPLSRITIASMADLGYTVNFAAADPYTKP